MLSLLSVKPVLHWFYSIKWKVNIFSSLWWYILEDGNDLFFFRAHSWKPWPEDCHSREGITDNWSSDYAFDLLPTQPLFCLQPLHFPGTGPTRHKNEGVEAIRGWFIGSPQPVQPKLADNRQNFQTAISKILQNLRKYFQWQNIKTQRHKSQIPK